MGKKSFLLSVGRINDIITTHIRPLEFSKLSLMVKLSSADDVKPQKQTKIPFQGGFWVVKSRFWHENGKKWPFLRLFGSVPVCKKYLTTKNYLIWSIFSKFMM